MPVGLQEQVEPQLLQRCLAPAGAVASVVEGLLLQLRQDVCIVTKEQTGARPVHQVPREPVAAPPGGMVPEQPSQRPALLVVVTKMELIAGQEERALVFQVQPQAQQSWRVPRKPVEVEPLEQLDVIAVDGLPVEREVEIVREISAEVFASGYRIEGVLELLRMD